MKESSKQEEALPFLSVIIPFLNNHEEVIRVKSALDQQSYPANKIEIILVDNGSENNFKFPDHFINDVILLSESNHKNSPYSARNRGIEASKGEILVFLDANSRPDTNWLSEGIRCLQKSEKELIGGAVKFDFENQPTAAKYVDALTSINMQKAVEEREAAYTANLFVRKEVFEKTGLFEEGVRSGGDVRFTIRAKEQGFSIGYCPGAVVWKKARPAKELYRKKIRTGKGYFYSWQNEEEKNLWFYNFFRSLKPPNYYQINKQYQERYGENLPGKKIAVWFHYYFSGIVEQVSFVVEFFRYNLGNQRDIDRREKMREGEDDN